MAKRSVEENKGISGYLQEISEIKTSKNNNRYFEGKIQTESKQLQRLVVFTPDKHENYRSAATLGRPVKLINAIMTPNRSEIEVHVNRRTTMEINPEPLPFKRKLFTEEAASTSVAEVKIKDFKEPYQTGTVLIKVIDNSRGEEVVDFGWGKKRKKVITVGDETDSLELALYEQLIEKVEVNNCYKITNVSSRKYKNEMNLTTTMKTDIIQIADIPNVKEPVQVKSIAEKIEVQQCRLSVSYKCGNCRKGIELDDEELRLVKCKICKMTQRREKLENTSHLLLNVSTCDENPKHMKMVIFYPVIEKYFSTIDETLVMDELEEHFLINQNFTVEYFPNTDVIQKLTKN